MIDLGMDEACNLLGDLLFIKKGEYNKIMQDPTVINTTKWRTNGN